VKVNACAGIEENAIAGISLFPNPNNGLFSISCNGRTNVRAEIYNTLGVLIENQQLYETSVIDLRQEPSGIYIVKIIISEQHVQTTRILKQ